MPELQQAFDQIKRHIIQQMNHHQIPGLAWAIFDRKRILHSATRGVANIDSKEPVRPEHLFMTGSIGKSFTAVALLQLHDEGRLDLGAPVTDYLPWFAAGSPDDAITVHHLLAHTAGIIGVNDLLTDKLYDVWALRNAPGNRAPGGYHYSNVGYKTLGVLLEAVEGSSYGKIIRQRILDPLGMMATEPETTLEMRHKLVTGYLPYYDERPWLPHHGMTAAPWLEIASGDGCMAAPPGDLVRYARALMNRDPRLLSGESFDLLTAKHIKVEENHWYGYGIDRDEVKGHTILSHGGEMPGHMAYMWTDLDTGLGFVIMINCLAPLYFIAVPIHETLAAAATGQALPDIPEPHDRREIEDAGKLAGSYITVPAGDAAFEVIARDRRLFLRAGDEERAVWQVAEDRFVADHAEYDRLPLYFRGSPESGWEARHGVRRYRHSGAEHPGDQSTDEWDARGRIGGHYRTYGSVFTNFRIVPGWDGGPIFLMPDGEEWSMESIDAETWRLNETPETVRFDTFVEGQALRAIFSGCSYYRTFTA